MYTNKHKQTHIASHYLTLRCSAYCIAYIHLSSSLYLSQGILIPMTTRRSCGRCLCGYSAYAHGAVDLKVNAARPTKSVRLQTHTSRRFDWSSCPGNTALQYKMVFQVQHVMEELMRASPYKHVFFLPLFSPYVTSLYFPRKQPRYWFPSPCSSTQADSSFLQTFPGFPLLAGIWQFVGLSGTLMS